MIATVRGVVFGSLIIAMIQGVVAAVGLTLFGVPGALIWAGLVVIAAQVPMLGTSVIMLPAVGYLFLTGNTTQGIGLLVWSLVAVGLVDNILQPFIVGGRTRMHALLILLSMLGGLNVFGPIGFIFGPTILAAFLVMIELYRSGILEKDRI
jgi:predicted PurR-regulated permease PerM